MNDISKIIKFINDVKVSSDSPRLCILGSENQMEIFREIFGSEYDYIVIPEKFYNYSDKIHISITCRRQTHSYSV